MKPISELSPAELTKRIAKADEISSALCSEFIAAGRGYELPSETITKTDPLALRWRNHAQYSSNLRDERDRRMTYHGSLKRIPSK